MFCRKCGNEIPGNATVCGFCGTPVSQDGNYNGNHQAGQQNIYGEPAASYSGQSQENSYSYQNPYQNGMYNPNQGYGTPQNMDGGATGMAIASLVLGIVALLLSCCANIWWLTATVAILGIVFGVLSLSKKSGSGRGMAIAGIVCSGIALIIEIVILIIGVALVSYLVSLFGSV